MILLKSIKEKVYERRLRGEQVPEVFRHCFDATRNLDLKKTIRETSFVVIDTETTGLKAQKGDELLSIAGLGVRNGRVDLSRSFYELIRPQGQIPRGSVVIHNLTPDRLRNLPPVEDVVTRFFEFCEGDVLVGHHVCFDIRFLDHVLKEHFGITLANRVLDTAVVAMAIQEMEDPVRVSMEGKKPVGLDELAKRFGITMPDRHDAYGDAFATALIFQRQLGILEKKGIDKLKDLFQIGAVR